MQREAKKYLYDVKSCIENIETFVGEPKMYSNFERSLMLQHDVRNKIIHGYDEIQSVQVWNIIINHLPLLKQEVERLLS